jgi:hypothetical protein
MVEAGVRDGNDPISNLEVRYLGADLDDLSSGIYRVRDSRNWD